MKFKTQPKKLKSKLETADRMNRWIIELKKTYSDYSSERQLGVKH